MDTLGATAPEESVTVPVMEPLELWPYAASTTKSRHASTERQRVAILMRDTTFTSTDFLIDTPFELLL
jgi:hypothetical protein